MDGITGKLLSRLTESRTMTDRITTEHQGELYVNGHNAVFKETGGGKKTLTDCHIVMISRHRIKLLGYYRRLVHDSHREFIAHEKITWDFFIGGTI